MAYVSELMIAHPEMVSFAQLEQFVAQAARDGEIHLYMDVKPEYPDTPQKWEVRLEHIFYMAEVPPK
jgi:hypothetical protein